MSNISKAEYEQLMARVQELEAQKAALEARANGQLTLKVGDKGGISVYGFSSKGFPTTLYWEQWQKVGSQLFNLSSEQIAATTLGKFAAANTAKLSTKANPKAPANEIVTPAEFATIAKLPADQRTPKQQAQYNTYLSKLATQK